MSASLPVPELFSAGQGPPVLLLHPLGVDRTVWSPVSAHWSGLTVLDYDLPGHGGAGTPTEAADLADLADQAAQLLRSADVGAAHVVGVSLGGLVGQALAAHSPDLVRSLVVVDAVAVYPPPMRQMWAERAALVRSEGMAPVVEPTLQLWFTEQARADDAPPVPAVRRLLGAMDPEGYARACELLASVDTRDLLGRIAAPTLVVCGDDDAPAFTAAAPELARAVPDGRLAWLPGLRHAGAFEQPERTAELLEEFFAGVG
ncbi:alpha/beta fold hydrolase [Nocardioides mesophilus]|uniref:Alpha/beta fold hydrolase n=1 Tax=Nocardioides mesophilus TaxID=433659 RepID=A0A7G9RG43_9ACTN|nr:alpha/beta fold hydrolase [Nocardioides mesophilus]QNN54568.1 alpha/beta fold hydrolase [Nocardioides mesophilus]